MEWQRQRQWQRCQLVFIITNGFVHTGAAMATAPQVNIFGKCQNLGGSDEMYYAATIQFSKNIEFVHCNYHKFIFANE